MFSFMAALRTLVLPFGTLTGTRIVLDGVNGRISVYDASDLEAIRLDSASSSFTVTGSNGSAISITAGSGSASRMYFTPPTLAGHTWQLGELATFGTTSLVGMRFASPYDEASGVNNYSQVTLLGGSSTSPDTSVVLTADAVHVEGGTLLVDGAATFDSGVTLSNGYQAVAGTSTTTPQMFKVGSSVITTSGAGAGTISTGLTTIAGVVAWNGDSGRANIVTAKTSVSGGDVTFKCWIGNTGGTLNSTTFRLDWIAIGT